MAKRTVVSIDYGSNRSCTGLSPAGTEVFRAAMQFLALQRKGECTLAYCAADLPSMGMHVSDALRHKWKLMTEILPEPVTPVVVPAKTSIEEARNICRALLAQGIEPTEIVIFCDRWHEDRIRMIWEDAFPWSEINIRSVRCEWGNDYACSYMRSELRWAFHNIRGWLAMLILGVDCVGRIKQ